MQASFYARVCVCVCVCGYHASEKKCLSVQVILVEALAAGYFFNVLRAAWLPSRVYGGIPKGNMSDEGENVVGQLRVA